jgi:hypothetical protein
MAIIDQLATSNTFSQWLGGTQTLISKMNSLTDGGVGSTFYANTNISVSNNVTITGNLTVSGNIVLDTIGFDDLEANGSVNIGVNLTVAGNTVLGSNTTIANSTVTYSNITTANVINLAGQAGNRSNTSYDTANSASVYANGAFVAANSSVGTALAFAIALG